MLAGGRAALPAWWGTLTGGRAVGIVVGSTALGALVTVVAGSEPGVVLCLFLIAGTVCAALAIKPRAVYKLLPVPVLAYVVAAMITGMIRDAAGSSLTALALGAAQWIASGFIAMIIATLLVIAIALARLRGGRSGRGTDSKDSSGDPGFRPAAAVAGRSRRPPVPGIESPARPPAPGSDNVPRTPASGAETMRLPQIPAAEPESPRRPPPARSWPGSAEPGTRDDFPASAAFRDYGD